MEPRQEVLRRPPNRILASALRHGADELGRRAAIDVVFAASWPEVFRVASDQGVGVSGGGNFQKG